ncbi:MAG: MATE family efflux transporter [Gracilibacteraceae bacterium]|jgi:putative MATE family efflux protein|nr:MATE family efflux transporter [Gracilibacteraceae bacterium]
MSQAENKMGAMPVGRLLFSMSLPMMISMLVQALYNIVDSIFVAQIAENALTALSLAFPVQNMMISVAVGLGVGINAFLSKSLGEKNSADVNKSATNGLALIWAGCAVFALAGFLLTDAFYRLQTDIEEIAVYGRDYLSIVCIFSVGLFCQIAFERLLTSTGRTFLAMITQSVGAIANIILDPIMIFGLFGFPALGVKGAAIATVISQILASALALYFNLRFNREISLSFRGFRPDGRAIRIIFSVGLPAILMMSIGSIMIYGLNRIIISFTATAVAVFGVYFRLQSFIFMPVFGLTNALVPILAYNYGARQKDRIVRTIRLSMICSVSIMTAGFIIFELFPDKLLMMFNATDAMLDVGITALRVISVSFLGAGFCVVAGSVFQAFGQGVESLIISVARQLIVLLPAAWLLSFSGSLDAVWWSFPIAEIVTVALSVYFMRRLYYQKIKDLSRPDQAKTRK